MHRSAHRVSREQTLRWRGGWIRVRPWRGDDEVAYLAVGADRPPPPEFVERCLENLREQGRARVVTSALTPADALPFVDAGFTVRERLHLLTHDMTGTQPPARSTRRARATDRHAVLALDHLAFDEFWRLDEAGLDDAIRATPVARFRVAGDDGIAAYAISGRSGNQGYLQRLAVAPSARREGWGRVVVADGLRWLARHGVRRTLVNTQLDNTSALALYEACGFRRLAVGLCVLGRPL
ncbi:MAG: GNAT family N-acetyltransferase [Acidimicrobiia bacterium]